MIEVECPSCHKGSSLPDSAAGKRAKCPCGTAFLVPPVAPAIPPPPVEEKWFYGRGGQQIGPVSRDVLRQLAQAGQLSPTDLVWKQGTANWTPAGQIAGLLPNDAPVPTPTAPTAPALAAPDAQRSPLGSVARKLMAQIGSPARRLWAKPAVQEAVTIFGSPARRLWARPIVRKAVVILGVTLAAVLFLWAVWNWILRDVCQWCAENPGISVAICIGISLVAAKVMGDWKERAVPPVPQERPASAGLAPDPAYVAAMMLKRSEERRDAERSIANQQANSRALGCLALFIAGLVVFVVVMVVREGDGSRPSGSQRATAHPESPSPQTPNPSAPKRFDREGAAALEEMIHKFERSEATLKRSKIRAICYIILCQDRPREILGDLLLVANTAPAYFAGMTYEDYPGHQGFALLMTLDALKYLPSAAQESFGGVWELYQKIKKDCERRGTTIEAEAKAKLEEAYGPLRD
ncbi:MAG: GYF domain-containing protein [Planctomycetota bacterium]|nr:GYF domain-containing protein [Planctomycetota bacterium]